MLSNVQRRIWNKVLNILAPYLRYIGRVLPDKYPQETRVFHVSHAHIYCGYYDVSPLDDAAGRLLVLRAAQENISPHTSGKSAEIGYYETQEESSQFIKIADTRAWNWQQGARQQWLPSHDDHIIYNDFDGNDFCSYVRNVNDGRQVQTYPWPIYTINPEGKSALSLNFSRLHHYRAGYGYHNIADADASDLAPANDGLFLCNLNTGERELLVSLWQLANFESSGDMATAGHYINHLQWTPNGQSILFFHQWQAQGKKKKQGRLMLLEEGGKLRVVAPHIRPSHTAWRSDGALMVTGYSTKSAAMYHLLTNNYDDIADVCSASDVDGHPSFIDGQSVLTDTYPNIFGFQRLFLLSSSWSRQPRSHCFILFAA
jgi:hypothetical protein